LSGKGSSGKSRANSALLRSASWLAGEALGTRAELADRMYEWRKSPAALDSAIAAYKRAVAVAPVGSMEYSRCLGNLAICLSQRFSAVGDPADLDDAIACGRQGVNGTPLLSSNHDWIVGNLAIHLKRRYDRSRQLADLEASVFFARQSARETSPWKRKEAAQRWARFGQFAFEKYRDTGNEADLHAAIDASRRAIEATRSGDAVRATRLATLSANLHAGYVLTQEQAYLDEAAVVAAEAATRLPADPDDRASCLSALAQVQLSQFGRSGQLPDLERAVETGRRAVAGYPADDPGRAGSAVDLALFLVRLFETTGAPAALGEAQAVIAEAVALTEEDSPARHIVLAVQAMIRWREYERTGQFASLMTAAAEADQVIAALPPGHLLQSFVLSTMGMIELRRYERTAEQAALDRAIMVLVQAVEKGGRRHYFRAGWLSMLGICLGRRFERTGNAADLDDAIDLLREGATTGTAYSHIPLWLTNLCAFLRVRFERTSDMADIDEAIEAARRAVAMAGAEVSHQPLMLSSLGGVLLARHHSSFRHENDIDDAIDAMRAAAEASQPGHTEHPMHLMNLGLAHNARFDQAGALHDAAEGVRYCREALAALPDDHGDRALYLANLSTCLDSLADETRDRADAAEALDSAREALGKVSPDHPERARYLKIEGNALQTRYDLYGDPADLSTAFSSWRAAASITAADPADRLATARYWGRTAAREGVLAEAVGGFSAAVKILPEVIWHGLNPATRQQQAARWAGLAADAASSAVLDGKPELAVELLEQGRSMLWSQALNLRADLADLQLAAPELASRLEAARAILNAPVLSSAPRQLGISLPGVYADGLPVTRFHPPRQEDPRARAARDYDETLRRIRQLDGFEHYLEPTPYAELATATGGGAAVIVNASRYGCHAIIVTPDTERARVVDLPRLDLDAAEERASQMSRLLGNARQANRPFLSREADRRDLLDILSWLWEVISAPVLDSLADFLPVQVALPRIWWCPTGPLVSLPLHAAGHHPRLRFGHDGESTLARTVSSYIPTLTSLGRARGFAPPELVRQLTVATPDLQRADMPALSHVSAEVDCLTRHFPPGPANHQLIGPAATRAAATTGIAAHDWIHLACHAGPLSSDDGTVNRGFALWDGELTVTDLAAQPGRQGGLAFLSACQTAAGSDEHPDEALHLAAAMQFIGYSHVIATMWSIKDAPGPLAAETFYTTLSQTGNDTASALRAAIMRLRETDPTDPFTWAAYAHYGH